MKYRTFKPSQKLDAWVKHYWTLESEQERDLNKQTIVPDGCMEMVFHYGDLYKQYRENTESFIQPRCFVIGQLTQPLVIEPTGKTGIFSIRFHPEGFSSFATLSIKEMENTPVSLEILFGERGLELEQFVLKKQSIAERIQHVESFLRTQLTHVTTIDRIVKSTTETILTAHGQLPIIELTKRLEVSRRQLERKFSKAIGLSPKQLSKIIRLQAVLKMVIRKEFTSFTALAYEGDYYDQAHFIKDFKEFTGQTPKEFYGPHLQLSSLFYGMQ